MTTVISDNVHNFAVEGTSDELDIPIKKIFADWEYKNRHNLCSINSLNWARVLIQGGTGFNINTRAQIKSLYLTSCFNHRWRTTSTATTACAATSPAKRRWSSRSPRVPAEISQVD